MVVVAYAEYVYVPAWNEATGRYTQVYEMSVGVNWRYTSSITPLLGDTEKGVYVKKNSLIGIVLYSVHIMLLQHFLHIIRCILQMCFR